MTEEEVLALNNPEKSYWYCIRNTDANVALHEDVIVNSGNAGYACDFARYIYGVNIERLQKVIIESDDPYYIYWFAKIIKNSNKEELFKAMLKSCNEYWINLFIKEIPISEDIKELIIFI